MSRCIRMICVLANAEPGGAELSLVTHLGLRPSSIEARAVLMADGPIAGALREIGVGTTLRPLNSARPAEIARFAIRFARLLRAARPDLILAVGNKSAIASIPVGSALRIPCVWQKVDGVMPRWQATALSKLSRLVIAVSNSAADSLPRDRLAVIYQPVRLDSDFVVSYPRPQATLTCVGRLEPTKGQHLLIAAARMLRDRFPAVNVLLAGGCPSYARRYPSELTQLADRLEIPLEMTGHVDCIETVLNRTTVYAQPSFRDRWGRGDEALGIALAEASWAGLPVVAARTGGIPEVVQDGVTGKLVPPSDPVALADAIGTFLADPSAGRAAGAAGSRYARSRFRAEDVAAQLFSALASLGNRS